ncbi:MAG: GTP pyrophosphokinase family protein [Eubacterium sp.]|nr:GTP pyrophosphokinase family protein [Eubacterium sp.]
MNEIVRRISVHNAQVREKTGDGIYEHLESRVKGEQSMREKCDRKGLPQTPESALADITDSIGLRIVTRFVDDIYSIVNYLKSFPDLRIVKEKDYIRHAKPNGYRSYHLILEVTVPYEDIHGNNPGQYYVEIQLRTIAMDMWASLEHQLKYKHNIANEKIITSELKRSADELASCDISMQTIRTLIREGNREAAQCDSSKAQ